MAAFLRHFDLKIVLLGDKRAGKQREPASARLSHTALGGQGVARARRPRRSRPPATSLPPPAGKSCLLQRYIYHDWHPLPASAFDTAFAAKRVRGEGGGPVLAAQGRAVLSSSYYTSQGNPPEPLRGFSVPQGCPHQRSCHTWARSPQVALEGGRPVALALWDTPGSPQFQHVSRMFVRGADVAVVCWDATSRMNWERLKVWVSEPLARS